MKDTNNNTWFLISWNEDSIRGFPTKKEATYMVDFNSQCKKFGTGIYDVENNRTQVSIVHKDKLGYYINYQGRSTSEFITV